MLGLLTNRWIVGGLAGLIMLGFSYWKGYTHGKEVIQKEWDADKVVQERAVQELKDKARETERTWQAKADQIQKEQSRAAKNITTRYNALVDSLRNRPEARADGMPEGTDASVGCTGAGLAKPDAEFLAGYAADAARLQAAYNSCKAGYEVIQDAAQ